MPTIKLKLNTDSINQALKEVKAYQRKVEQAPQKLIEYLTAQGVEIAKMNVSDMNAYDSGELYNSIHAEQKSGVGYVIGRRPCRLRVLWHRHCGKEQSTPKYRNRRVEV